MNKPKLSVVLACYNSEFSVERTIKSIKAQTLKDFECLVIDDGSGDGTIKIIEKLIGNDLRFKIYCFEENQGVSYAKNYGIKHAKTSLVSFIDSDDYISPFLFEKLLNAHNKTSADIVFCDVVEESDYQYRNLFVFDRKAEIITKEVFLKKLIKDKEIKSWFHGKLFSKKLFEGNYLKGRKLEDFLLFPNLVIKANYVAYIPYTGYHYEIRENSLSRVLTAREKFEFLKYAEERKNWVRKTRPALMVEANSCLVSFYNNFITTAREEKHNALNFLFEKNHRLFVRRQFPNLVLNKEISWKRRIIILIIFLYSWTVKE